MTHGIGETTVTHETGETEFGDEQTERVDDHERAATDVSAAETREETAVRTWVESLFLR